MELSTWSPCFSTNCSNFQPVTWWLEYNRIWALTKACDLAWQSSIAWPSSPLIIIIIETKTLDYSLQKIDCTIFTRMGLTSYLCCRFFYTFLTTRRQFTITEEGVFSLLSTLNIHKACGPDLVNAIFLKQTSLVIIFPLL